MSLCLIRNFFITCLNLKHILLFKSFDSQDLITQSLRKIFHCLYRYAPMWKNTWNAVNTPEVFSLMFKILPSVLSLILQHSICLCLAKKNNLRNALCHINHIYPEFFCDKNIRIYMQNILQSLWFLISMSVVQSIKKPCCRIWFSEWEHI